MVFSGVAGIENCLRQISISLRFGDSGVVSDLLIRFRDLIRVYSLSDLISVSEKLDFFFHLLPRVNDLVNRVDDSVLRSRLLLQVYHLVLLISSFGRTNPGWRLFGGANILSSVLVGLPDWVPWIDVEGLIADRRFDEVNDFRYFLTISMGVYIECILMLDSVEYSELISWASSAFFYGDEYLNFLERIDFGVLVVFSEDPLSVYRQYLFPMWNQFAFMHNLLRIFGDRWPSGLVSRFGHGWEGVLKYIVYLKGLFMEKFSELAEISGSLMLDVPLDESPHVFRLLLLTDFLEIYEEELNQYLQSEPNMDRLRHLLLEMLDRLVGVGGGFDMSSSFWTYYYDIFDLLLEVGCPPGVTDIVESNRDHLVLLYYKAFRLDVLKGGSFDGEKVDFLKAGIQYSPHAYIDVLILETLHLFGVGDEIGFMQMVDEVERFGHAKLVSPCLDLLKAYCVYLRTGNEVHFPPLYENPFDANSWHFDYRVRSHLGVRRYYPFGTRLLKIQGFPFSD